MKAITVIGSAHSAHQVALQVELVANEISAYDNEAACRYAREVLADARELIDGVPVDLSFADGKGWEARFVLPEQVLIEAELTDGEEGDPEDNMSQGTFEVRVQGMIVFHVFAPESSHERLVLALAEGLLASRAETTTVPFQNECFGSRLELVKPFRVSLVK